MIDFLDSVSFNECLYKHHSAICVWKAVLQLCTGYQQYFLIHLSNYKEQNIQGAENVSSPEETTQNNNV